MRSDSMKRLGATLALASVWLFLAWSGLQALSVLTSSAQAASSAQPAGRAALLLGRVVTPFTILVDDFKPQPYQGDTTYYFNRLNGDRGALNDSLMDWGRGEVTATLAAGRSWGGIWLGLNHPVREGQAVNFSALLPAQVLPAYQSQVTGLTVQVARSTPGKVLKVELKDGSNLRWSGQATLQGAEQTVSYDLPALGDITVLVLVLDQAAGGDYLVIDRVALTATTSMTDVAQAAFVWSYGMLLNNQNPATALVRDKAKDASGEFDAIQATGGLAAATAIAEQLGVVDRASAVQIVSQISNTLLTSLPRYHGLWPHWVISDTGMFTISPDTEWSSVDTVVAAMGLLDAQSALDLDTSGTVRMLQDIDWNDLVVHGVGISHGYAYSGARLASAWDTFGGESWLVGVAYAAATQQVPPLQFSTPPTANGSGFIDEVAWLLVWAPGVEDYWGVDWDAYRMAASYTQTVYYSDYPTPTCFDSLGLFGLSAGEVPDPSQVTKPAIYQPFGVGGRFDPANDGTALLGYPVVMPHYSAMIASLRPTDAISMWTWLMNEGPFSPLNDVESFGFPDDPNCSISDMDWNQLKGSWNLTLQSLGWGRYLAERLGQVPVLWQATLVNKFLRDGYLLLVPDGFSSGYLPMVLKGS